MEVHRIYLIGYMGSGKTTVARYLAERLGWSLVDTDALIEEREQLLVSEIFAQNGEDYFRGAEAAILREVSQLSEAVIATGGGIVLCEENRKIMKTTGFCVLLTATPPAILARLEGDDTRPLLTGTVTVTRIQGMLDQRAQSYQDSSHVEVATDGRQVEAIGEEIINKIKGTRL